MKKTNLIIIIALFIIPYNYLHSQIKLYYGIKTGMVSAHHNIVYDEDFISSSDSRIGFDMGAFIESSFNKTFSLSAELHYIQKGEAYDEWKSLIECLSIPVMLKIKTQAGNFTPYLLIGPRLDVILNYDKTNMNYKNIGKNNFGLTSGIGCELKIWKNYSLLADIRYDYDFTGFYYSTAVSGDRVDEYSRSLEFLVGVKF